VPAELGWSASRVRFLQGVPQDLFLRFIEGDHELTPPKAEISLRTLSVVMP